VVLAGALDGDEQVVELVPAAGFLDLLVGAVEGAVAVRDFGRLDADGTEEVGEQELGPGLGGIETEDAEVLGPDGLDPARELAARFV
jgi:hypothetical protein